MTRYEMIEGLEDGTLYAEVTDIEGEYLWVDIHTVETEDYESEYVETERIKWEDWGRDAIGRFWFYLDGAIIKNVVDGRA